MAEHALDAASDFDPDTGGHSGSVLLRWLKETWDEAGKTIVTQFLVFYGLMLIGFLCIFWMMRSTAKLREFRRNIAETIRQQRDRKFDVDEYYRTMPGGGYF